MSFLCVIGSLNVDLVIQAERLPAPGETLLGGPFATFRGGKGANQAVAAARLGAAVTMIGCVGADDFGRDLRAGLVAERIETRVRRVAGVSSGVALITVLAGGENTIVVAPGANAALGIEDLDHAAAALRKCTAVLLQLEIGDEVVTEAARRARELGKLVVLNAAPARTLDDRLLAHVDVLIVNRGEAQAIAGAGPTDDEGLLELLQARGVSRIVLTRSADGAVAVDGQDRYEQAAFPVEAVDAVGAGDAFAAAFTIELARGHGFPTALRVAAAAGALATTRPGAQPSLPRRAEVQALLDRHSDADSPQH